MAETRTVGRAFSSRQVNSISDVNFGVRAEDEILRNRRLGYSIRAYFDGSPDSANLDWLVSARIYADGRQEVILNKYIESKYGEVLDGIPPSFDGIEIETADVFRDYAYVRGNPLLDVLVSAATNTLFLSRLKSGKCLESFSGSSTGSLYTLVTNSTVFKDFALPSARTPRMSRQTS